jgi:hypothetical protein
MRKRSDDERRDKSWHGLPAHRRTQAAQASHLVMQPLSSQPDRVSPIDMFVFSDPDAFADIPFLDEDAETAMHS